MDERDLDALVAALRRQRQLDEDGVEVAVSRQACDHAADAIAALRARAEADAERLNWLEIHAGVRARTSRGAYSMEWLTNGRETLRAAIDRARSQGEGTTE